MLDNHWQYSLKTFFLAFLLQSDWSEQKTSDIFILTSIQLRDELQQRKRHIKKIISRMHLTNSLTGCDCHNWFTHMFKYFAKEPFSRFVVSLERLGERPWVSEKLWKTFSHRKFVKKNWKTYQKFVRQKK